MWGIIIIITKNSIKVRNIFNSFIWKKSNTLKRESLPTRIISELPKHKSKRDQTMSYLVLSKASKSCPDNEYHRLKTKF